MCKKRNSVEEIIIHEKQLKRIRVDKCIRHLIKSLTNHGYNTVACCCGHGIYPITIICREPSILRSSDHFELISGIEIPRTRNFYKLDSKGFYYIPEVVGYVGEKETHK